jgi:hypothetical protein
MPYRRQDADYLREKASQFRKLAPSLDEPSRTRLLEVAIDLEAKAAEIEQRPDPRKPGWRTCAQLAGNPLRPPLTVKTDRFRLGRKGATHMPSLFEDPDHWRLRADQARAIAAQMTDQASRLTMLEIATHYDVLAERADARRKIKHSGVRN